MEKVQFNIKALLTAGISSSNWDSSTINVRTDEILFLKETMFVAVNVKKISNNKVYTKIFRVLFTKDSNGKVKGMTKN